MSKVTIGIPGFDEEEGHWQDVEYCSYETELLNEKHGRPDDGTCFIVKRCDALAVGFVYPLTRGRWDDAYKQTPIHVMGMWLMKEDANDIALFVTDQPLTPFGSS